MPELQQQLRRALEDILGELQLAQMVRVAPTLVIGLGGSRTWTARRLKRLRQIRYGQNQLVRFLFIDCDQSAFASDPALADVTDAEKVLLHIPNPEQIYRDAVNGVGEYAKMREWLPDGLNVTLLRNAKGAGGIRPVGRFALFASLNEVRQKLEGALNAILAIERELETLLQAQAERVEVEITQPRIYIVGSLCGGTGSSLFLDIAVLVRHLMRQVAPNVTPAIIGLFFLPSVFTNENFLRTNPTYLSIIRANGYAALKELEYFCDADTLKANPFTFRYPNMPDIEVNVPVYDEEFVLERGTADGRMLTTKEEVFELAARSLMADIGSPVGAQVRAANANIVTMLTSQPCPQTKKRRFIHSLGITALSAPITELLVHGTCEKLRQFVNDQVLGTVSFSADELKQTVDGFLQANKLEEQGSRNDLIERLLHLLIVSAVLRSGHGDNENLVVADTTDATFWRPPEGFASPQHRAHQCLHLLSFVFSLLLLADDLINVELPCQSVLQPFTDDGCQFPYQFVVGSLRQALKQSVKIGSEALPQCVTDGMKVKSRAL